MLPSTIYNLNATKFKVFLAKTMANLSENEDSQPMWVLGDDEFRNNYRDSLPTKRDSQKQGQDPWHYKQPCFKHKIAPLVMEYIQSLKQGYNVNELYSKVLQYCTVAVKALAALNYSINS